MNFRATHVVYLNKAINKILRPMFEGPCEIRTVLKLDFVGSWQRSMGYLIPKMGYGSTWIHYIYIIIYKINII